MRVEWRFCGLSRVMGAKMRKIGSSKSFDCTVRDSLSTIRATHVRLHLLNGSYATAALLASQIELYDVLLGEVSGIHTSLARDLKDTRLTPRGSLHTGLNA
jgi:hypothetical protein